MRTEKSSFSTSGVRNADVKFALDNWVAEFAAMDDWELYYNMAAQSGPQAGALIGTDDTEEIAAAIEEGYYNGQNAIYAVVSTKENTFATVDSISTWVAQGDCNGTGAGLLFQPGSKSDCIFDDFTTYSSREWVDYIPYCGTETDNFISTKTDCESTINDNLWISGTGYCSDFVLTSYDLSATDALTSISDLSTQFGTPKTKLRCEASGGTWIPKPVLEGNGFVVGGQASLGFPDYTGVYNGQFETTFLNADGEMVTMDVELIDFSFASRITDSFEFENDDVVFEEFKNITYSGVVIIEGQRYDITESIFVSNSTDDESEE